MRSLPDDPMAQHSRFIAALCADWREAGTVTRDTPRASAVLEISKQLSQSMRDGGGDRNPPPTNNE